MQDYYDVLARLHRELSPKIYLEIGVRCGDSLGLALPGTLSIGVDPEPALSPDLEARTLVFRMSSDDFFAERAEEALGGRAIDFAFIDGMHLFEFALRDFINIEARSGRHTVVALHDCLPRDAETSSRERATDFWTGDAWKVVFCLLEHRPDLRVSVIDAAPSGVAVISNLNPSNTQLAAEYEALVEQYSDLGFDYFERHRDRVARVTTGVAEALEPAPRQGRMSLRRDR